MILTIKPTAVREAREAIASRFIEQIDNGRQSSSLPTGFAAVGQFFDLGNEQRGVHGSAAALRVLSDDRIRAPKLIRYLTDRSAVDQASQQTESDSKNVIKLSETLFGLSHVELSIAETETARRDLGKRILAGRKQDGWSYFLDSTSHWQALPTAFAVQALRASRSADSIAVNGAARLLLQTLRDAEAKPDEEIGADISVRAFCLYVLAFGEFDETVVTETELKRHTDTLWRRLSPLMAEDVEQNIAYFGQRQPRNHYVRVPHQLYMLAVVSKFYPLRHFASTAGQKRITAIVRKTLTNGFNYPHSGTALSSRTHAILYDCLTRIEGHLARQKWPLVIGTAVDALRSAISSRAVALVASATAALILGISVIDWYADPERKLADMGPDAALGVLVFMLALGKRRDR